MAEPQNTQDMTGKRQQKPGTTVLPRWHVHGHLTHGRAVLVPGHGRVGLVLAPARTARVMALASKPQAPKSATTKGTAEDRRTNEEWEEEEKEDEEGGRPIRSLRLAATHSSRCRQQQQQHAELQSQPRTTPPQQ
ncbi:hypothetical protein PHYSODRAFT_324399 [Phytophthora sojae]|uniref:Uncharacterized protein n=1 Tax=Phytophthora sojae (strain P6497) TaxID=1094619 RepID=G4YVQ9_PHYSP|nr:hypothetical protein PHYSODRAFT_324399 [Phytophthora sojae]EGZ23157.1 hypothetical protein PHYSODRAFT_324399 [Phytophthora sojae]|eukprot:XP_009518445.1 hypothetical protein PHYSODRAFT_324399 [Phytophthora sojae]